MHTRTAVRLLLCASLLTFASSRLAFAQGTKVTRDTREANETERDQPEERAKWFLRGRTVDGRPAPELLHKAYQQKQNNRRLREAAARKSGAQTITSSESSTSVTQSAVNPFSIPTTGGPSWVPLGPSPSGTASVADLDQDYGPAIGRVTVVAVDQSDSTGNTVYIGGASGGLWKSSNAADSTVSNCNTVSVSQAPYCAPNVTWTPLIDQQAALTVGAMAIQPGNNKWLVVGTGEANNSADSYYGLGFLVSQDGGSTWTLVSTATAASGTGTIDLHGLGTTKLAFSTDTPTTVVATMAAASGGLTVGAEFSGSSSRGIYFSKDAGLTWQRAIPCDVAVSASSPCPAGSTPDPGSANSVIYNPFTHLFYANLRYHGFYSSPDGQYWTRLANQPGGSLLSTTACPATPLSTNCPVYRAELALVPGRGAANNKGEMYTFMVNSADANEGIFQSVDGGTTWTAISTTGITNCGDGTNGACGTTQGSYNLNLLAVPNGSAATDLYAGTVNEYRCTINPATNPTCSTTPFANLTHTYGSCGTGTTGAFAHVHPDQHGIDFSQAKPDIVYFGNDGGIYRTLKSQSGNPATQTCNSTVQPWIEYDNLGGTMGSMLQTVWFSQSPSDSSVLLAGTQDNGTMAKNASSTSNTFGVSWQSVNNGDGGFNDINPVSPQEWFVTNPNISIQQCINSSGITCTANTFNEIVNSSKVGGDSAAFYTPFLLDPQAANHLLVGTCRLWRIDRTANLSTSWPTASPLTYNLDQFVTAGTTACASNASNMISAIAAGGPCNGACNSGTSLTGPTGNGSQVIYVGTEAGKLFVTTAADNGAASWADRSSGLQNTTGCQGTGCPISGIAIDKTDTTGNTAYVTVMGFKTTHVFKTTNAGVNWTPLDGNASTTGLPDSPADSVALDPNTKGVVYVGTDVGVFKSVGDGTWTEVGPSSGAGALPNVAITAVRTFGTGANTHLRVSTYGRGQWDIPIPNTPGFQLTLSSTAVTANVGQNVVVNGTITPFNGYASVVNIQCTTGVGAPIGCTPSVSSVNTASGAQNFTITINAGGTGNLGVSVNAIGTDAQAITQQQSIAVNAVLPQGFSLSAPAQATAVAGATASTSFNLTSMNGFSGPVTLACTGLPSGAGPCSFSPATPNLTAGGTVNVTVNIPTGTAAASSTPYSFTVTASSNNSLPATANASLLITIPPDFTMSAPAAISVAAGLTGKTSFTVTANSSFSGTVNFACTSILPTNSGPCAFSPASATLTTGQAATINLSLPTTSNSPQGTVTVTVTSTPTSGTSHSQNVSFTITAVANAFEISTQSPLNPVTTKPGMTPLPTATLNLKSSGYAGTVSLSCSISPATQAGTPPCTFSPSQSVTLTAGNSQPVIVTVNTSAVPAGNGVVTVTGKDNSNISATSDPFSYSVTDYTVTAGAASAILPGGSATVPVSLAAQNGYSGTVNASCAVGTAPVTCSLSPVGPYSVSGTTNLTATITGPGSSTTTASGNYNLTITTSDAGFASLAHNATIAATVQDYKLQVANSAGTTTSTVTAGGSATFNVTPTAQAGGFSGQVTFNAATICSGLPSKTTCTVNGLSSGQVTVSPGTTVPVVITTTAATTASLLPRRGPNTPLFAFWTMLPGAAGIVVAGRRRKRSLWALLGLTFILLIIMTACGGGGGGSTTPPPPTPVPGTPAGTYTVTLNSTASSGATAMTRTAQITLTVQ